MKEESKPIPVQLKEGEVYIIDEGRINSGRVELIRKGKHFSTVQSLDSKAQWETMTSRLSEQVEWKE